MPEKEGTAKFLEFNADSSYYRLNLNDLRECVSKDKEACPIEATLGFAMPLIQHIEGVIGLGSEEYDKNTPFANDEGFYFFIKASPADGKNIEKRVQDFFKENASVLKLALIKFHFSK